VLVLRVVERVVESGGHSRGVAERRVLGDVLGPFAVDPDLPVVLERVEVLLSRHRAGGSRLGRRLRDDGLGAGLGGGHRGSFRWLGNQTEALARASGVKTAVASNQPWSGQSSEPLQPTPVCSGGGGRDFPRGES